MSLKYQIFCGFLISSSQALASQECVSPNNDIFGKEPEDIRLEIIGQWYFVNADVVSLIESRDQMLFTKRTCERGPYVKQGLCVDFGHPSETETYRYDPQKNVLCSVGIKYDCYKIIGFNCGAGNRDDTIWIKTDAENRFPGTGSASSGYRFKK